LLRFVIQFLIPIALAIFAVVDCVLTPKMFVRALPKSVWILLILIPYVGALLWILTGRGVPAPVQGRRATDTPQRGSRLHEAFADPGAHEWRRPREKRELAPDDDPEFLRRLGEQMKRDRPEG
jgi:hypothetical protein